MQEYDVAMRILGEDGSIWFEGLEMISEAQNKVVRDRDRYHE